MVQFLGINGINQLYMVPSNNGLVHQTFNLEMGVRFPSGLRGDNMTEEVTIMAMFIMAAIVVFLFFVICFIGAIVLLGIRRDRKRAIREARLAELRFREEVKNLKYI